MGQVSSLTPPPHPAKAWPTGEANTHPCPTEPVSTASPSSPHAPRCSCPAGFEGPTCGVNTDDCVEHTCANGGTCVDGMGNYTCQCPQQYSGRCGGPQPGGGGGMRLGGPATVGQGRAWAAPLCLSLLLPPRTDL